eukprot:CAMPEP_0173316250 /NCGR_PEP_ID=MMETSP1143-20121109/26398_1 /TAXON_ID=483371 /ORGANISM="non described non described, Strain CCMP2298" /LENGTH=245 /DNA_ID=CAMNT_0014259165 /DNA_START=18 /DNA_END=755 /DNA_ORIENTATION=-
MYSPRSTISSHGHDRDFNATVCSGTSSKSPLGRSVSHDHYIKPVPPMYVTEYEGAYTWPPGWAYGQSTSRSVQGYLPSARSVKDEQSRRSTPSHWDILQRVTSRLIERGYERHLFKAVQQPIAERRFDALLEYTYNHLLDVVGAVPELAQSAEPRDIRQQREQRQRGKDRREPGKPRERRDQQREREQGASPSEEHKESTSAGAGAGEAGSWSGASVGGASVLPDDVMALCREWVEEAVQAIKRA